MSDDSVEFVIKAVKMVAEHGWKLLPQVIKYFCKWSVFNGKDPSLSSGSLVVEEAGKFLKTGDGKGEGRGRRFPWGPAC